MSEEKYRDTRVDEHTEVIQQLKSAIAVLQKDPNLRNGIVVKEMQWQLQGLQEKQAAMYYANRFQSPNEDEDESYYVAWAAQIDLNNQHAQSLADAELAQSLADADYARSLADADCVRSQVEDDLSSLADIFAGMSSSEIESQRKAMAAFEDARAAQVGSAPAAPAEVSRTRNRRPTPVGSDLMKPNSSSLDVRQIRNSFGLPPNPRRRYL